MSKHRYDDSRQWYAIHTYSGYEEKVSESIKQRINAVDMADKIFDCIVPKEKQIQIKNGKRKVIDAKIFQGYVLVEMKLTDETWYIVKNIKGVFNFVGVGEKPLPLTEKEMQTLGIEDIMNLDFEVGDTVRIITEPFYNYTATIEEIFKDKKRVKVKVSMFGRETTVDLEFDQIQKI